MVGWPKQKLPAIVEKNLERFRESAAVRELDADARQYTLVNFPWIDGFPQRFILRDERGHRVEVTFDSQGTWRMNEAEEPVIVQQTEPRAA